MPIAPSTLGFACFAAVKLVGYSASGAYLRRRFGTQGPHPFVFGVARTLVGLVAGLGAALIFVEPAGERTYLFYLLLAPVRFLEWYLVLALFFTRSQPSAAVGVDSTLNLSMQALARQEHFFGVSALGILWSYVLDLPVALSLFTVSIGAWLS